MMYLTDQHTAPPMRIENDGMLVPIYLLMQRNDSARLAELGVYEHVTLPGDIPDPEMDENGDPIPVTPVGAPLGYTDWQFDGTRYARSPIGTYAERLAAAEAAQLAAQEAEAQAELERKANAEVTDLQALLAIDHFGYTAQYESWVNDPSRSFKELAFIQRAKVWKRSDETFNAAADALSFSEQAKDDFFIVAAGF